MKLFHAGCGAFTSLALKVKGIESLQDVPGRDFWLCQQRALEQTSFSLSWPRFLPWRSGARDTMSSTELCYLALEMSLVMLVGPVLATAKPFPPVSGCCQTTAQTWENTSGKMTFIKGGRPGRGRADGWQSGLGEPRAALPSSAGAISRWVRTGFPAPVSPPLSLNRGCPCLARVSLVTGPRDAVQSICHQLSLFCSALYARSIVSQGR